MLVKVFGAAVQGIDATLITIEVNSSRGCMFYLVGLPDSAVKESHQRIISALQVNGYKMPTSNIVINMAPADIVKKVRLMTYLWLSEYLLPMRPFLPSGLPAI
jgi:magnesium chelatase family protein